MAARPRFAKRAAIAEADPRSDSDDSLRNEHGVELNLMFNAQSGDYREMVAAGILDTTKVVPVA